jgi:hypothetical protein
MFRYVIFMSVLALAACSERSGTGAKPPAGASAIQIPASPSAREPAPVQAHPAHSPPEGRTVSGDGSQIQLSALTASDLSTWTLDGELGCSFEMPDGSPLLIAKGDVASRDPAFGLVKVTGYVERIATPGGFDAMLTGATFSGQGKTIRIGLTGPAASGGESPSRPATLTYMRADGASLTRSGRWVCGP